MKGGPSNPRPLDPKSNALLWHSQLEMNPLRHEAFYETRKRQKRIAWRKNYLLTF